MPRQPSEDLVFLPLGGVGEIGMNLALYGYGKPFDRTWIVVDFGVAFAKEDLPGVDLVYPDISYLEEERANVAAIFLTHAHEDHFGALVDLWPRLKVPVYATPFAAGLIEAKLVERPDTGAIPVTKIRAGERAKAGPFEVEYVNVAHSIPEANALVIRTPLGTIVHSGDYKLDPTPVLGEPTDDARLREIGREGVLALVSDSTNAMREGTAPSEADVARELARVVAGAQGRVAVTTFASNVGRLRSVAMAAQANGRHVVVAGRAMHRMLGVARDLGMLDDMPEVLGEDVFQSLPRNKVVLLMTGSQGEPRAAFARVAQDEHPRVDLTAGDTFVFSARAIPGNERAIFDLMNGLSRRGIHIVTDDEGPVHVSGHPRPNEMRALYDWIRPNVAIPVHGEAMHLAAHADLARAAGVATVLDAADGAMVRLAPGRAETIDHIETGRIYRDGDIIGDLDAIGVIERRRMSFTGHVAVGIALDTKGGVAADPEISLVGLPDADSSGDPFEDVVMDAVLGTLDSIPVRRRRDPDLVREAVRRAVRAAVAEGWGKKPVCSVLVSVV